MSKGESFSEKLRMCKERVEKEMSKVTCSRKLPKANSKGIVKVVPTIEHLSGIKSIMANNVDIKKVCSYDW